MEIPASMRFGGGRRHAQHWSRQAAIRGVAKKQERLFVRAVDPQADGRYRDGSAHILPARRNYGRRVKNFDWRWKGAHRHSCADRRRFCLDRSDLGTARAAQPRLCRHGLGRKAQQGEKGEHDADHRRGI